MRVFGTALVLMLAAMPAMARESAPFSTARDTASLVTDTDAVAAGQPFHAGLRLRLAPGWHTYWQNPGDAGLAPELAVTLPGATVGPIMWPAPQRVAEGPITTFAYTGEVLLPVAITAAAGAAPLRAHATWLVCRNICVPEEADFAIDLPAGVPALSSEAPLFATAAAHSPVQPARPAQVAPDGTLSIAGLPPMVMGAQFFPDTPGLIDAGANQPFTVAGDTLRLRLPPGADFRAGAPLTGLLVLQGDHGETYLSIDAAPGPAIAPATALGRMLLLALAGGLILNLMPCVFPVLAMKALAIARLSQVARGEVRRHALSYMAGVVLAFTALGGGLLAIRLAGHAAGWGFQFQSPAFVAVMAWLLFAVGLNLSGVFAVGGRITGAGQALASRHGHWGSFCTGLLAVLVATPCTAPFMGAAVAGALSAPAGETLLVFAAMGLGLALPYAALAVAPGLARALPRPGAWMDVLKQALAFPMYGAAAWLVWVISQEAGPDGVLAALAGLLALAFAGWAMGRSQAVAGTPRRFARFAALAGVIVAAALLPGVAATSAAVEASAGTEPFSAGRLAELRRDGRPVFVNMTAAWCVSCLVNERLALSPQPVQDAFRQHGVAYLRGDWTRQDPAISAFLRDHGRDGVPLYVYYAPGRPGAVLPQILTEQAVLDQVASGA